MFRKINNWFDSLREPYRFLVFMGILLIWLVPLYAGILGGYTILAVIGCVGMAFTCFLAITRISG